MTTKQLRLACVSCGYFMFLNISFLQFVIVEVTFFDTFLGCMSEPLHASVAAAINLLLYLFNLFD